MTTIKAKFNVNVLPEWARGIPDVVKLARQDLAFRIELERGVKSLAWRRILIARAERSE